MDTISIIALVVLFVVVLRQRSQLSRIERDLAELRGMAVPGAAKSEAALEEILTSAGKTTAISAGAAPDAGKAQA